MAQDQKGRSESGRARLVSRLIGFGRLNLGVAVIVLALVFSLPWAIERFGERVAHAPLKALATGRMAAFQFDRAGETPPNVIFQTAGGADTSFLAFRGQTILINLWATWCAPCVREMPSLDVLQALLGGEDFQVVAIALDREGPEIAGPFLEDLGVTHLELHTESNFLMSAAFGESGLPVSILIDERGKEVGRLRGPADWSSPEAQALIRYIIGKDEG